MEENFFGIWIGLLIFMFIITTKLAIEVNSSNNEENSDTTDDDYGSSSDD